MLRVRSLPRYHPVPLALALSLLPAGAVAARAFWRTDSGELKASLFDDAMISMSYARTFAEGHGLVWHPGAPRVEGITNLSWTLVMSLLHRLGLGPVGVVVVVMALGLGCVWLTAAIAVRLARSFRPADRTSSFFVAAVVALNFPLLFWAVRGMEVGLVTMLALLACLLTWELAARHCPRRCAALAVVVVVGIATRTDFAVVPLALGGWAMLSPAARRLRILVPLAVGTVTSLAGTTLFRLWYYDRPVPNTYYLKLEGVSLFDRLSRGLTVDAVIAAAYLVPPLVLVALGWRHLEGRERSLGRLLLVVAAAHVAYSTYAGGDAWEMFLLPNRYLTPAVVCLYLLAALVTTRTFMRPGTVADGSSTSAVAAPPTVASVPPTATTPTTPNAPAPAPAGTGERNSNGNGNRARTDALAQRHGSGPRSARGGPAGHGRRQPRRRRVRSDATPDVLLPARPGPRRCGSRRCLPAHHPRRHHEPARRHGAAAAARHPARHVAVPNAPGAR